MRRVVIILCIFALIFASLACDWDWDSDGDADQSDTGNTAKEAIETYGAEQFHAQLTAIELDRITEGTPVP